MIEWCVPKKLSEMKQLFASGSGKLILVADIHFSSC